MDVIVDTETNLQFFLTHKITVDGILSERDPDFCANAIIEIRYDGEGDLFPCGAAFRYVADVEIDEEAWLKEGVLQTKAGVNMHRIRYNKGMYENW